jgi:tRNA(Ile)-lysidine synthetase-like protein
MINQILNKYLKDKDIVVAAISGGPDSMALLHNLIEYRKQKKIKIICAHVNHKVRVESDSEEEFVRKYCNKNNVIFESYILNKYSGNFENDAHHQRYDFFEQLIIKYKATFLLTAHHGDDLIESILLKIIRGSSLKGYKGFEVYQQRGNYAILRPLIHETKTSILEYNKQNDIEYVIDATNFEDIHTRNRIRKYILPILKKENKNIHEKFIKFNQEISDCEDYINLKVEREMSNIYNDNKIDILKFLNIDFYIQKKIIQKIIQELYETNLEKISDKHINMIMNLILNNSGKYINLPADIIVFKNNNYLYFQKKEENSSYKLEFKDKLILPNGHVIEKITTEEKNSNYICRLNKKDIELPLYVRTRQNGDRMDVKNMDGTKKINDIFTDSKIPTIKRNAYPILVDSSGKILWLPGLKKSKFDIEKDKKCDIILRYN